MSWVDDNGTKHCPESAQLCVDGWGWTECGSGFATTDDVGADAGGLP